MEKKTYEELENEVAALKRSCASYKSENTKLRERCAQRILDYKEERERNELLLVDIRQLREELDEVYSRSWWERFKALFWIE